MTKQLSIVAIVAAVVAASVAAIWPGSPVMDVTQAVEQAVKLQFGRINQTVSEFVAGIQYKSSGYDVAAVRDMFSLTPLLRAFGDDDLHAITLDRLKTYKTERRKEVQGPTINRELSLISHIFTYFKIVPDPTIEVARFQEHERIRVLEKEEIDRLLSHAGYPQKPMTLVALNAGFRVSDIRALKWTQVNFERRTITLVQEKTGERMIQPMTDELYKTLQLLPRRGEYVFCDAEERPYQRIIKGFRAACKRAGIKDFRFHDLRHTFASHYLMNGGDIKTLQVLMGHKSIVTTSKYAHFVQQHLAKEIKRIDNLFGGNDANDANGQERQQNG